MQPIIDRINKLDWERTREELHDKGFAVVEKVLFRSECKQLIEEYDTDTRYRKTINMERYRFGSGEYKYFGYPLPDIITQLRESVFPAITPVANQWMEELDLPTRFPKTHQEMIRLCREQEQTKPTALILKYGAGGFNTLHQDLYGEVFFPMQMVFVLNQAGEDHTGGEFVITEQVPRAQSKANVLTPGMGDMLIFTTRFRPVKGTKGYYRVNMKHGVSPLHSGTRFSLGVIFHDALS
ncbi:MAG TPA: 2OG-Fe(II) oxygenase [Puia sp.]|nr:2OG-Fe(II) oxygenase [Puia sp.]